VTATTRLAFLQWLEIPVRAERPVTLSLVAVDAAGRRLRTIKRTTTRDGRFVVSLSRRGRHALRLDVGKRHYWSWIDVAADPTAAIACEHGAERDPQLKLDARLRAGQSFTLALRNPGRCAMGVLDPTLTWERATPRGWEPVPAEPGGDIAPAERVVGPKRTFTVRRAVPGGLPAGHYRVAVRHDLSRRPLYRALDVSG
jgi:hypothetical protein